MRCQPHAFKKDRFFILNPIVGPEPVAGSSRMKGGSMTKILLETILCSALNFDENSRKIIRKFEAVYRQTYFAIPDLAEIVDMAASR